MSCGLTALAYGMKAVIPLEVGLLTIRTEAFDSKTNDLAIAEHLDWVDSRRDGPQLGWRSIRRLWQKGTTEGFIQENSRLGT